MKRRQKTQGILGEVLKRMPMSQMGELKLPKEILHQIQFNIEKTRDSILGIISNEVSRVASTIDAQRVLEEVLQNHRIRFSAEIVFEPKNNKRRGKRP